MLHVYGDGRTSSACSRARLGPCLIVAIACLKSSLVCASSSRTSAGCSSFNMLLSVFGSGRRRKNSLQKPSDLSISSSSCSVRLNQLRRIVGGDPGSHTLKVKGISQKGRLGGHRQDAGKP